MAQVAAEPIRLNFKDTKTFVLVTPEDEDRFITTAAEAAQACQQAQHMLEWKREFDELLRHIHVWGCNHATEVSRIYMAFSNDGLKVFVLTQGGDYNFDFDDTVSELDIELAKAFSRCPTDIMQLPETPVGALTSFFDTGKALQLYGE